MTPDRDWWRQAVVYHVYPRSFSDSDGDGIGDIPGVLSRVDHIADLGVDAVWLSPFYPSPLADGGYDISDHRSVDPRLGTVADVRELVEALHARGIRLFVDIVPNHASDRHPWFLAALAGDPAARARFVFRDGLGPDGDEPPSDWPSHFGGPAWTRTTDADGSPGPWYLHLFAPEQPDFDWSNPDVQEDFRTTLRFWADLGVDGFRIDVAHSLAKDLSAPLRSFPEIVAWQNPDSGDDPFLDRNEVHDIYRDWRRLFDEYDPPRVAVAEAVVKTSRRGLYTRPDELHQVFNFDLLDARWDVDVWRAVIGEHTGIAAASGVPSTWVLGNHDNVRPATRYGLPTDADLPAWLMTDGASPVLDRARGLARLRAATLLILALPGSTYLYQGDELGLHEVADLQPDELQDPIWQRSGGTAKGRDGARVPLPWSGDAPPFGFGGDPHLPQPAWFADVTVEAQATDPRSTLSMVRRALAVRREVLAGEDFAWVADRPDVLHVARGGGWESVTNFGASPVALPAGEVLVASADVADGMLPADATAWLRVG